MGLRDGDGLLGILAAGSDGILGRNGEAPKVIMNITVRSITEPLTRSIYLKNVV
jgi:hypothetical protein